MADGQNVIYFVRLIKGRRFGWSGFPFLGKKNLINN